MARWEYPYKTYPLVTCLGAQAVRLCLPVRSVEEGRWIEPWLRDALGDTASIRCVDATAQWEIASADIDEVRDAVVDRYGICDVASADGSPVGRYVRDDLRHALTS